MELARKRIEMLLDRATIEQLGVILQIIQGIVK